MSLSDRPVDRMGSGIGDLIMELRIGTRRYKAQGGRMLEVARYIDAEVSQRDERGLAPHGTVARYVEDACQCSSCRAAYVAYMES